MLPDLHHASSHYTCTVDDTVYWSLLSYTFDTYFAESGVASSDRETTWQTLVLLAKPVMMCPLRITGRLLLGILLFLSDVNVLYTAVIILRLKQHLHTVMRTFIYMETMFFLLK